MKHETRLLSLEIKSKNLPMLCLLPHTLKSGDRHYCFASKSYVAGTSGSNKSKTSSVWPPPPYLPSKHHTNAYKWPKLTCTHKNTSCGGGGVGKIVFCLSVFPTNTKFLE